MLKDGTRYFKRVVAPKGNPANPLTSTEVEKKFRNLTGKILSTNQSNRIVEMIMNLEKLEDTASLVRLCCVSRKGKRIW